MTLIRVPVIVAVFCLAALNAASASAVVPAGNLIVNPGGEDGPAGSDTETVVPPGWTTTATFTVLAYGSPASPTKADSAALGGGANFFAGGTDSSVATASQTVDVSAATPEIDAGGVMATVSAALGGFGAQGDNGTITATYLDSLGSAQGSTVAGPVTPADRNNTTGLQPRSTTGAVPPGTRSIVVELTATRTAGTYNDGYLDNASLTLGDADPTTPQDADGDGVPDTADGCPTVPAGTPNGCPGSRIVGTSGNDRLVGTPAPDIIEGGGGDDIIDGAGGNDKIRGGLGADVITGGPGDDIIREDQISTGRGLRQDPSQPGNCCRGRVDGGPGNDTIDGGGGRDVLVGGVGRDVIAGGLGNDVINEDEISHPDTGGVCCDGRVDGGPGNDNIDGGGGGDVLTGGPGRDGLLGGPGKDRIDVRDGARDVVNGGRGSDSARIDRGLDRVSSVERCGGQGRCGGDG